MVHKTPYAWLEFKAGVVVVFELGSHCERELVRDKRYLILNEFAVNIVSDVMWSEVKRGDDLDVVAGAQASAQSPNESLTPRQPQMMDEIYIKCVARLPILRGKSVGAIVIGLDLKVGALHANRAATALEDYHLILHQLDSK